MKYLAIILFVLIGFLFIRYTTYAEVDRYKVHDLDMEKKVWLDSNKSDGKYEYNEVFFMPSIRQTAYENISEVILYLYSKKINQIVYIDRVNIGTISLGISGKHTLNKFKDDIYYVRIPEVDSLIVPSDFLNTDDKNNNIIMTISVHDEQSKVKHLKFFFQKKSTQELTLVD